MVNNHAVKDNNTGIQRRSKTYSTLEIGRFLHHHRELFFIRGEKNMRNPTISFMNPS